MSRPLRYDGTFLGQVGYGGDRGYGNVGGYGGFPSQTWEYLHLFTILVPTYVVILTDYRLAYIEPHMMNVKIRTKGFVTENVIGSMNAHNIVLHSTV